MDDREQQRKVKHRLAVIRHAEEITGNVAPDVPVLRHQPTVLLQVEAALRRARRGGPCGTGRQRR